MKPLTDQPRDPGDSDAEIVAEVILNDTRYRGAYRDGRLQRLEISTTHADRELTSVEVRATPLRALREALTSRALLDLPAASIALSAMTEADAMTMTVDRRARGLAFLVQVARAFSVAELFGGSAPARVVADVNKVTKATAYRWRQDADAAGLLTDDERRKHVETWVAVREIMGKLQSNKPSRDESEDQ